MLNWRKLFTIYYNLASSLELPRQVFNRPFPSWQRATFLWERPASHSCSLGSMHAPTHPYSAGAPDPASGRLAYLSSELQRTKLYAATCDKLASPSQTLKLRQSSLRIFARIAPSCPKSWECSGEVGRKPQVCVSRLERRDCPKRTHGWSGRPRWTSLLSRDLYSCWCRCVLKPPWSSRAGCLDCWRSFGDACCSGSPSSARWRLAREHPFRMANASVLWFVVGSQSRNSSLMQWKTFSLK